MAIKLLAKLLPPPEKKFFNFFEEGAEVIELSSQLFYQTVHSDLNQREEFIIQGKTYKRRALQAMEGSLALLNATFITPIDREDIQLISTNLYKSTKIITKACVNLRIYKIDSYNDILKTQAEVMIKSAEELRIIISMLKKNAPLKEITACNYRIKEIENRGDEILFTATEEIFSGKYEALYALKMRDIYKGIENAMDICTAISDLIVNIALKQS
jgi:Phosphate transport regulator (distant homolog of PhoU)